MSGVAEELDEEAGEDDESPEDKEEEEPIQTASVSTQIIHVYLPLCWLPFNTLITLPQKKGTPELVSRQTQVAVNPTGSGKVSAVSNRYAGISCMKQQKICGEHCFECAQSPPP